MGHRATLRRVTGVALVLMLAGAAGPARAEDFVWEGSAHSSGWYDVLEVEDDPLTYVNNWGCYGNPPVFPSSADDVWLGDFTVDMGLGTEVRSLHLDDGGLLTVHGNYGLVFGGDSTNDGVIHVYDRSVMAGIALMVNGSVRLDGTGEVQIDGFSGTWLSPATPGSVLTIGPQQTVAGRVADCHAAIGVDMVIEGAIDANVGRLDFGGDHSTNTGLVRACSGGQLNVTTARIDNAGGTIRAQGGTLNLRGTRIVGGTIDGNVPAYVQGGVTLDGGAGGITLEGPEVRLVGGAYGNPTLFVTGQIINTELIHLAAQGSRLVADGNVALGGGGRVAFGSADSIEIAWADANSVLTIGPAQTIAADAGCGGTIWARLDNTGLIDANGGWIDFRGAYEKRNDGGTIRSRNGGGICIRETRIDNAGGTILADDGGLRVYSATIAGGQVRGTAASWARATGAATFDGTASPITVDLPQFDVPNGSSVRLKGTVVHEGAIALDDTGNGDAFVRADGNAILTGAGRVIFGEGPEYIDSADANSVLTIGPAYTVASSPGRGGTISARLDNTGLIDANGAWIYFRGAYEKRNDGGTIRSRNGGGVCIRETRIDNAGGTILADDGGLRVYSATIAGGLVRGNAASWSWATGAATFDGTDSSITVDLPQFNVLNGSSLRVTGTVINEGTIFIEDSGSGDAFLRADGNATLGGSGRVVLGDGGHFIDSADGNSVLTIGPQQTITAGPGCGGPIWARLDNTGLIDANGGGIEFRSLEKRNVGGTIRARHYGSVSFLDTTVVGGTIDGNGSAWVGVATFDGTEEPMTLDVAATHVRHGCLLTLKGTINNNGTIWIEDLYRGNAYLRVDGDVLIGGTGRVVFGSDDTNILDQATEDSSVTIGPAQTLLLPPRNKGGIHTELHNQGTVDLGRSCNVGTAGDEHTNSGRFLVTGGRATVVGDSFTNLAGGTIGGCGELWVADVAFRSEGCVAPGLSVGTLTVTGAYVQTDTGTLDVEIGQAGCDLLNVLGPAEVAGTLDVTVLGGFLPNPDESFVVLSASGGVTDDGLVISPDDADWWRIDWAADAVAVTYVRAMLPGDTDQDDDVDYLDYLRLKASLGLHHGARWSQGDFDADGDVDNIDLVALEDHFGLTYSPPAPGAPGQTVPEPATGSILVVGGLVLACRRRRRRDT